MLQTAKMTFRERIEDIIKDNQSGSSAIAENVIEEIQDYISKNDFDLNELILQLNQLYRKLPFFIVVFHLINSLFLRIEKLIDNKLQGERMKKELSEFLEQYQNTWKFTMQKTVDKAYSILDLKKNNKILTISNSLTIQNLFEECSRNNLDIEVFQSNSGPANEGKIQAKVLSGYGFQVNYIADAAVSKFVPNIDLIILGADCIFNKSFVNKVGSLSLALLADYYEKPIYIISDTRKLVNQNEMSLDVLEAFRYEKPKDPDELWEEVPQNIYPRNYYFEFIPNKYVNAFILDNGLYSYEEIENIIKTKKNSRFFDFALSF